LIIQNRFVCLTDININDMEKTVTKEEVERVLDKYLVAFDEPEKILNELFPPEFKVGDWVVGWGHDHSIYDRHKVAWRIGQVNGDKVHPSNNLSGETQIENIRHATPEEIAASEWEEGKPYKVRIGGDWMVRISADKVGRFYNNGYFEGCIFKNDKYEKL